MVAGRVDRCSISAVATPRRRWSLVHRDVHQVPDRVVARADQVADQLAVVARARRRCWTASTARARTSPATTARETSAARSRSRRAGLRSRARGSRQRRQRSAADRRPIGTVDSSASGDLRIRHPHVDRVDLLRSDRLARHPEPADLQRARPRAGRSRERGPRSLPPPGTSAILAPSLPPPSGFASRSRNACQQLLAVEGQRPPLLLQRLAGAVQRRRTPARASRRSAAAAASRRSARRRARQPAPPATTPDAAARPAPCASAARGRDPDPQAGEGARSHAHGDRAHLVPARAGPLEQLGEQRQQLGRVLGRRRAAAPASGTGLRTRLAVRRRSRRPS